MTRAASSRRAKAKHRSNRVSTSPRQRSSAANDIGVIPGYDPIATAGDCTFNSLSARLAVDFFAECLTFTAGEWRGAPFTLQPWQTAIVANLFGWKRPDGLRRYREAFIYVPRKRGKSELAGGLGNLLTFADGEPAAQTYCAAAGLQRRRRD